MVMEAKLKNIKLSFGSDAGILQQVKNELNELDNEVLDQHPLFKQILTLKSSDDMPQKVIGDYERILQVAMNLIQNAIKNTYEGGVFCTVHYNEECK